MKAIIRISVILGLSLLYGCGTSGPILGYDEKANVDKASLATVYIPPAIELLEVDGVKKNTPFIEDGHNELHIPAGRHQIAVRYLLYWGDATSGSIVSSEPVVLRIDISPKSKYFIKYDKPEDAWAAEKMVKVFSPWVEDTKGNKLASVKRMVGGDTLTSSQDIQDMASPVGANPLDNLKFWWKKAGFKDKKEFEKWMNKN